MKIARMAPLVFIAALAACVAPTTIVSNKAPDYAGEPKRIFVLTDVGTEFGEEYFESFRAKLITIAKDCGATLGISKISYLELDGRVHLNRVKQFNPDIVLYIRRRGGTTRGGAIFHVVYDVRLIEYQSNQTVWRASADFHRGGVGTAITERGQALAMGLTDKMKEDQIIFRSCQTGN